MLVSAGHASRNVKLPVLGDLLFKTVSSDSLQHDSGHGCVWGDNAWKALQIHEYAQVQDLSGILEVWYVSLVGEFPKSGVLFGRSPN